MTMMQKMQAKKSKKGFTLVELVIVIAILAILAAIAIPVITTTINSSKMSTMQSDCATVNMLVKEAINTSKAEIKTTTWDGSAYSTADLGAILKENDLIAANDATSVTSFCTRTIGGVEYKMVFTDAKNVAVSGGSISAMSVRVALDTNPAVTTLDPNTAGGAGTP